jgi:hypothetical protein
MKIKLIVGMLAMGIAAQAGIIRVVTYPVRHPIKTQKTVAHYVWKVIY